MVAENGDGDRGHFGISVMSDECEILSCVVTTRESRLSRAHFASSEAFVMIRQSSVYVALSSHGSIKVAVGPSPDGIGWLSYMRLCAMGIFHFGAENFYVDCKAKSYPSDEGNPFRFLDFPHVRMRVFQYGIGYGTWVGKPGGVEWLHI